MTEHPLLMCSEMVRATLAGLKTQTRRIVKPQPGPFEHISEYNGSFCVWWDTDSTMMQDGSAVTHNERPIRCPYGAPGDILVVRESLQQEYTTVDDDTPGGTLAVYAADGEVAFRDGRPAPYDWQRPTLPSIHMPRWAARLLLPNTGVGVEFVQDISPADLLAEGITLPVPANCSPSPPPDGFDTWSKGEQDEWFEDHARTVYFARCADVQDHIDAFQALWDGLHAKPKHAKHNPYSNAREDCLVSYPWEAVRKNELVHRKRGRADIMYYIVGNPLVWRVNFKLGRQEATDGQATNT